MHRSVDNAASSCATTAPATSRGSGGTDGSPRGGTLGEVRAEASPGALTFGRWGLRFADRETERAYREWHIDEAIPFTRIGMETSVIGWIGAALVLSLTVEGFFEDAGPLAFGLVVPLILVTLTATFLPQLRRWVLPLTVLTNATSGLVASWALLEQAYYPEASGVVVLIAYFGFVVFRLHPLPAFAAVSTYVVFHEALILGHWRANELSTIAFVIGTTLPTVAITTGVMMCALLDRLGREAYRRHRIIEAQRRELADLNDGLEARVAEQLVEIRQSRQRIVTAQDAERRRLERDLHDGAQQQLIALKLQLALAASVAEEQAPELAASLTALGKDAGDAIEALRALAHGIYPPLLVSSGLVAALRQQVAKLPLDVDIAPDPEDFPRLDGDVEAAVYFCCLEALQNVAKHARATHVRVTLACPTAGELHFTVVDDGQGFDAATMTPGHGLTNLTDRIAALGGTLDIDAAPGEGTTVRGRVPVSLEPSPQIPTTSAAAAPRSRPGSALESAASTPGG
jgi:signal transduction histidine kinase